MHTLIFSVCWCIYVLFAMPYADKVIGICEGTPGHDYSKVIIVLPLYFALFGFSIFRLFKNIQRPSIKLLISSLILIILPLGFSLVMIRSFYTGAVKSLIKKQNAFNIFYEYGCYGDADLKYSVLIIISTILLWISLFFLMVFISRK